VGELAEALKAQLLLFSLVGAFIDVRAVEGTAVFDFVTASKLVGLFVTLETVGFADTRSKS